jgi:hypothetical protein
MANFYVGEVLFEDGGTIDTPGDITVTSILDCAGTTGTAGQILSSTGTALEWITAGSAGIPCSILTAKGDIVVATGASTPVALPVGTDGQLLYACSAATSGLCWAAAPSGASPATPTVAGVLEGYSCGVDGNISVGFGSMAVVDPANGGCKNTSLGVCALSNLTFGAGNVAIGSEALFSATNVGNSIAIGNCALRASTFSGNVAIGNRAACTVTAGGNNVAIGSGAMQNATTPSLSIAIGCRAMQFGAGDGNIGFGLQALCKVSGSENIAIGTASGSNITTGVNNTFLGGVTGGFISTGSCNVFIGFGAGPTTNTDCCLWIGIDSTPPWLTGDNTSAIKPGAGIIDCANSCGTAGQILYSQGNAICWGAAPSGASPATPSASGTVFGCANASNAVIGSGSFAALTTGTCNSGIGVAAFPALTSGCYNIALGDSGGSTITSGCYNVAIGSGQSVTNPSGNCQLAIGPQLGFSWLTGDSTLAIKPGAGIIDCANSCGTAGQVLASNGSNAVCWISIVNPTSATPSVAGIVLGCTTADRVSLGCSALTSLTSGLRNVAVGVNGLGLVTTGCDNIAIGDDAACSLTSALCNIAIGTSALGNAVSVCSNTAIGHSTLLSSAGAGNVGVGNLVMCSTTSGASNTAVGFYALRNNTTGSNNVAVGLGTLCSASTSTGNVAVGTGALGLLTTAGCNTAVGASVLRSATGGFNTGLGGNALYANTTASNNVGIGANALICNTTGGNNNAVGVNALFNNTTGACNTAMGTNSLCLSNGSFNVALGYLAGCAITTGSNNLVLGYNAQVPVATGSCQLAIGFSTTANWLTGDSTKAIKPGAGIIDCADSCGTAGQVLMSNGANAVCWGTAGGGGSSATPTVQGLVLGLTDSGNTALGCQALNTTATGVGNIAIGYLSGSALTSGTANTFVGNRSGCAALDGGFNTGIGCSALNGVTSGCFNTAIGLNAGCALTTESYNTIIGCHPGFAGECNRVILADGLGQTRVVINDCGALSPDNIAYGTTGQVLVSNGPSAAFSWATPQTSPYVTYTTSAVTYTSGTPVLVAVWGGGTIQGTVTLNLVGYGGVNQFWDFYLSGDPTNYNTGWYQYATWPDPSNALSQGTWYVNFPVYPDPNANLWELYFNPAQNSLNASPFTFFYRPLPGSAVPAWQI